MTPDQAINLLEAASRVYKGTLQDHANLQKAVEVLREAVKPKKNVKPSKST